MGIRWPLGPEWHIASLLLQRTCAPSTHVRCLWFSISKRVNGTHTQTFYYTILYTPYVPYGRLQRHKKVDDVFGPFILYCLSCCCIESTVVDAESLPQFPFGCSAMICLGVYMDGALRVTYCMPAMMTKTCLDRCPDDGSSVLNSLVCFRKETQNVQGLIRDDTTGIDCRYS